VGTLGCGGGRTAAPLRANSGGAELPVVYIGAAVALVFTGPAAYSLDNALGIKLPGWMVAAAMLGAGGMVGYGIMQPAPAAPQQASGKSQPASEGGDTDRSTM